MIIIFLGSPLAGKGTQAKLLSDTLSIPFFSIGALLREGDEKTKEAYERYAMQGKNVPIELKFDLLKQKIDTQDSFILENFPSTQEDLYVFEEYLKTRELEVDRVFLIQVNEEEIEKRSLERKRVDDTIEVLKKRIEIQTKDREPVEAYYRNLGVVREINGNRSIEEIHVSIMEVL